LPLPEKPLTVMAGPEANTFMTRAEIQLMVIPAVILHYFQLELDPPDYQLTIVHDPTPSPGKQFKIRVVARRQGA
jgi:hypothetical protein